MRLDRKTGQLIERVINSDSAALIAAYEAEIKKLEIRKIALTEKAAQNGETLPSFEDAFRTACAFLASPWKIWNSGFWTGGVWCSNWPLRAAFPTVAMRRFEPPESQSHSGFWGLWRTLN
jgi:hypothetical protein